MGIQCCIPVLKVFMNPVRKVEIHATTILCVKRGNQVAIGGDGQVTLGDAIMKADAMKIRKLLDGRVLCGFAGGTADAFSLLEKFEQRLRDFPQNLPRAAIELAKLWRTDRALRQLQAMLITTDGDNVLLISGTGDVIQPTDGVAAIGSGGNFALAAAKALLAHTELGASDIVRNSMKIAGAIDIYTNDQIVVETLTSGS